MYRILILFCLLVLAGCSADQADSVPAENSATAPATSTAPAAAPPEAPAPALSEEDLVAAIRTTYANTEAALQAGKLRRDSFAYLCEETEGGLVLYSDQGTIRLVTHWQVMGDHGGETERLYFEEEDLVFYFREESSWQFGGPTQTTIDGTLVPGTIDKFTEDRLYLHDGELIRALTKSYEMRSWEDDVDPDSVPNKPDPEAEAPTWTYDFFQRLKTTQSVDCAGLGL